MRLLRRRSVRRLIKVPGDLKHFPENKVYLKSYLSRDNGLTEDPNPDDDVASADAAPGAIRWPEESTMVGSSNVPLRSTVICSCHVACECILCKADV